jgi:hypothetical protein
MIYYITTFIAIIAAVSGKVYFKENFNDAAWEERWVVPSEWKSKVRNLAGGYSRRCNTLTTNLPVF